MPPDPLILAFDTSAAHCAAALLCGDRVLAKHFEIMSKGQAERLFPILESLLGQANKTWKDLDRIGVGVGPGNFTGIRISVASARGLALSLGIPAVGVTTFEALAFELPRPVYAVIDAKGGQFYVQNFMDGLNDAPSIVENQAVAKGLNPGQAVVCLPGTELPVQTKRNLTPSKYDMAVAIGLFAQSKDQAKTDRPAPFYIREPDAAPPRESAPIIIR